MLDVLIKDIRELLPQEYGFHIDVSCIGLDVIFGEEEFEPEAIIVTYGFEEFAYFNLERMGIKDFNYGYDLIEVDIIHKIMAYLDEHSDYIKGLMGMFKK